MKKTILLILALPMMLCGCEETIVSDPNDIIGTWLSDSEFYNVYGTKDKWSILFTEDLMFTNVRPSQGHGYPVSQFCARYKLCDDGKLLLWDENERCDCDTLLFTGGSDYDPDKVTSSREFSIFKQGKNTLILYHHILPTLSNTSSSAEESHKYKFHRVKY